MVTPERYAAKVDRSAGAAGCWIWTGHVHKHGYGLACIDGGKVYAHRLAWELAGRGALRAGSHLTHRCGRRDCVNPRHLALRQGSRMPSAKLTETTVRAARRRRDAGETLASIARSYGVSEAAVSFACSRRTWRHVI